MFILHSTIYNTTDDNVAHGRLTYYLGTLHNLKMIVMQFLQQRLLCFRLQITFYNHLKSFIKICIRPSVILLFYFDFFSIISLFEVYKLNILAC